MTKTIKQLCELYDIGQTELSKMYDIPLRTVQDWHAGRRNPPPYVVNMLDELLAKRAGGGECDSCKYGDLCSDQDPCQGCAQAYADYANRWEPKDP